MKLFNFFKQPNYKEAAEADFSFWGLMNTGIATNPEFFNLFPPSDECCNVFEHKDWLFAAFLQFMFSINTSDKDLFNLLFDNIFPLMESVDTNEGRKLCDKVDFWQDIYNEIIRDRTDGYLDRVKNVMAHVQSAYCLHAFLWMFCRAVIKKISSVKNTHDYDLGADYLYKQFTKFVIASKTIQLYNSKVSK